MPAVRLVFLVALVVGLLAAIAASTTAPRDEDRARTGTDALPNSAPLTEGRSIAAKVPRKGPLVVNVGDTVNLTVTLREAGRVVIDPLGVHENVGPGVPMPVVFTATIEGTYDLKVQETGKSVLRIVVRPARESGAGQGGGSRDRQPEAVPEDEPRPV
jgi:heme/copper-type cytochrome/quinol oxidase subunit 2